MEELAALRTGAACATNQVFYALSQRGPDFDLLPWMGARAMPVMAYCPLGEGSLVDHPALVPIARDLGATPAQVALAWLLAPDLHDTPVIAIPKTGSAARIEENAGALSLVLGSPERAAIERAFPSPRRKRPLAVV
jgi:diketogulonate reductase-like aldo/keto reductase